MQQFAKAGSISVRGRSGQEWRERGERVRGGHEEALVFQEKTAVPILSWQGNREKLPSETYRRSAGSNVCSHDNLHCNQKLTGDGLASLPTAKYEGRIKEGAEARQADMEGELMRSEISQRKLGERGAFYWQCRLWYDCTTDLISQGWQTESQNTKQNHFRQVHVTALNFTVKLNLCERWQKRRPFSLNQNLAVMFSDVEVVVTWGMIRAQVIKSAVTGPVNYLATLSRSE